MDTFVRPMMIEGRKSRTGEEKETRRDDRRIFSGEMSVEEKQARSVFVGNIPHGTTEDQMKAIFSTIGPVISFRIVFDRETGNPKGYGFAEYAGKTISLRPSESTLTDRRRGHGAKCHSKSERI